MSARIHLGAICVPIRAGRIGSRKAQVTGGVVPLLMAFCAQPLRRPVARSEIAASRQPVSPGRSPGQNLLLHSTVSGELPVSRPDYK